MGDAMAFHVLLGLIGGYEGKTQPVEVPPSVLAAAERTLRAMARDFDEYADHGLSELGQSCLRADFGMTGKCSCGYEQAKERWRLP